MRTEYRYDVAFSLLDQDEALAGKIAELIAPLSVFLYSERQLELAGADGAEVFAGVFKRESRTVAVLFRQGWGKSKWTGFEERCIRDRSLNDGPDFVTLVNLDGYKPPPWFDETRIWADFSKLGPAGVAGVLKERAATRRPVLRDETAEEIAARMSLARQAEADRRFFLGSPAGIQEATQQAVTVIDGLASLGPKIGAVVTRQGSTAVLLYYDRFSILVAWSQAYANTTDGSCILATEFRGRPHFGGHVFAGVAKELRSHAFRFDRPRPGDFAWRQDGDQTWMSSERLVDWCGKLLLNIVERAENSGS